MPETPDFLKKLLTSLFLSYLLVTPILQFYGRPDMGIWICGPRLKEAGLLASTGSTGDSYDNAMAESINGLYKAEVIHRKSWKNRTEVELATLTWVDWYNNRRLLERLGHIPPAEAEKAYYASIGNNDLAA